MLLKKSRDFTPTGEGFTPKKAKHLEPFVLKLEGPAGRSHRRAGSDPRGPARGAGARVPADAGPGPVAKGALARGPHCASKRRSLGGSGARTVAFPAGTAA